MNTYWSYNTNEGINYIKPWMLAMLSMNLFKQEIYELEGFLMPGICPYRTSYTIVKY